MIKPFLKAIAVGMIAISLCGLPRQNSLADGLVSESAYQFSNASRLRIKFLGYSELTGEYNVGDDKIVSLPVLGRFSIQNKEPSQFEQELASKASDVSKKEAYVSVEILQYRPFYITGNVQTPGSYQWKPGLSVLHAISMSGGLYREQANQQSTALMLMAVDSELTQLKRAIANLKVTLAVLLRLTAEIENSNQVEKSKELVELIGEAEATALINYQNTLLRSQRHSMKSRVTVFKQGIIESENKIGSLIVQQELARKQYELRKNILSGIEKLWNQKTVNNNRLMTEKANVMNQEALIANLDVQISEAKGRKIALEQEVKIIQQRRHEEVHAQIETLQREASQLRIDIDSARTAYRRLTGQQSATVQEKREFSNRFEIVRRKEGEPIRIEAEESTLIMPGDILTISKVTEVSDS